jgi:large conductance mechanosensitive channel
MGMLQEFKDFAMRGNVVDMAVGIIIGGAFGKIVSSLVNDVVMPPIGMLLGGVDFSNLAFTLKQASAGQDAVVLRYGLFINTVIDFLIVAFAIFVVIKAMNAAKRQQQTAPAAPTEKQCPYCVSKIPIAARRCPNCTSQLEGA